MPFGGYKINTPAVCGLIKVRIILPIFIIEEYSELELKHIITHELVHIKRLDYLLKPLSIFALCIHWFNPVIWIAFILSQKDMEMSCDEKVMSIHDGDIRKEYAGSLIKLATKQNILLNGGLLAFGESNIKKRIRGVMNFKKPKLWLGVITTIMLIAIGVAFLSDADYGEIDKSRFYNVNLETVVMKGTSIKDGPGNHNDNIGELNYGDIIVVIARYHNWALAKKHDIDTEFWVDSTNLIPEQNHIDYNFGIITADEVTVGKVTLYKGNLVQILKSDENKACVTVRTIDISEGKTGWISNNDFMYFGGQKEGAYINQAYLRKGTIIYNEPSTDSKNQDYFAREQDVFVWILNEQDEWTKIFTFGPIEGWVKTENIYIPQSPLSLKDREKAFNVVREYFNAFEKADYKMMRGLATDNHNNNIVGDGHVWGMKWAKAKEIQLAAPSYEELESSVVFGVSVDMETVKASAQYPSTRTFFYVVLEKGRDGIWRVDRYRTG